MKKKEKLITWIIFILFVLLIFILALHHENWRDEAQAYLLCRDMNLMGIFKNVHYEGHPIFYYLFLYPLVKLGVGPKSVNILSFIFMSIAVYLVLFKSKLNLIQKICIIVSYPVLYEFSIVGRSYSLIFLLLVIWALIYKDRKDKPILYTIVLGCLMNTHLLMLGFVGINVLLFYGEEIVKKKTKDKKMWISLIILIIFGLIFFIQFVPMLYIKDGMSHHNNFNFLSFVIVFLLVLFEGNGCYFIIASLLNVFVYTYLYILLFKENKSLFFVLIFSYLFMTFIFLFVRISIYFLALALSLLFVIIISLGKDICLKLNFSITFLCILLLSLPTIIQSYFFELKYNYSSGYETSIFINNNISSDVSFLCLNDSYCSSIIPYVSNVFYSVKSLKPYTYVVWNREREQDYDLDKVKELINKNNIYYISIKDDDDEINFLKDLENDYTVKAIYNSKHSIIDYETFVIYKIDKRS